MLTRTRRLCSWECLLSWVCLRSLGICKKRGGVCNLFFGRLAFSRPPPDQLRCRHPSLSLVPLCGHTKTLFVLPSACLHPSPLTHTPPPPKLSPPKMLCQMGEGVTGIEEQDEINVCVWEREAYARIKISQVPSVVKTDHNAKWGWRQASILFKCCPLCAASVDYKQSAFGDKSSCQSW